MPLKRPSMPSPMRMNFSMDSIFCLLVMSSAGTGRPRATKHWLSGRRSRMISTSSPGLRPMCPPSGRIWRLSSCREGALRVAELVVVARDAEQREHVRRERQQPRIAARAVAPARSEPDELHAEAFGDHLVGLRVGILQQKVRVRDP